MVVGMTQASATRSNEQVGGLEQAPQPAFAPMTVNYEASSPAEKAALIANNPAARAAFMIANNAGSVNAALRQLGYEMDFEPKPAQIQATLKKIFDLNNTKEWDFVQQNFEVNRTALSEELFNELQTYFDF